jgi:hypothetical protein
MRWRVPLILLLLCCCLGLGGPRRLLAASHQTAGARQVPPTKVIPLAMRYRRQIDQHIHQPPHQVFGIRTAAAAIRTQDGGHMVDANPESFAACSGHLSVKIQV